MKLNAVEDERDKKEIQKRSREVKGKTGKEEDKGTGQRGLMVISMASTMGKLLKNSVSPLKYSFSEVYPLSLP